MSAARDSIARVGRTRIDLGQLHWCGARARGRGECIGQDSPSQAKLPQPSDRLASDDYPLLFLLLLLLTLASSRRSVSNYAPPQEQALWEGMARCYEKGLVGAVGTSNYGADSSLPWREAHALAFGTRRSLGAESNSNARNSPPEPFCLPRPPVDCPGPKQLRKIHAFLSKRGVPLVSNQVQYSLLSRVPETSGERLQGCCELSQPYT